MDQGLGLATIAQVMDWNNDKATDEYRWLKLISAFKYDGYQDFVAGARFIERLIVWLTQFNSIAEREIAYNFVKNTLVYFSPLEFRKLIELFYSEIVEKNLTHTIAEKLNVERYQIWSHEEGKRKYKELRRKTLFMGLSDGARIDIFRHINHGNLVNDQVVAFTQIDKEKWNNLINELRKDTNDPSAKFSNLYVIDDFTASGTTLLRKDMDKWKGKLFKLYLSIRDFGEINEIFEEGWALYVHHYLMSELVISKLTNKQNQALKDMGEDAWFNNVKFTNSVCLPESIVLNEDRDKEFLTLADNYYDPNIENPKHLIPSGVDNLRRGYGGCALPIVLEHNTPNNSMPIIWSESDGVKGNHKMRPLFRRHQRHE